MLADALAMLYLGSQRYGIIQLYMQVHSLLSRAVTRQRAS